MDAAVVDLSPETLTAVNVQNLQSYAGWLAASVGEVVRLEETVACFTGIPLALFNAVICPRFARESADERMAWLVEQARQRAVPMLWWVGPGSEPPDIEERLRAHGFVGGGTIPAMAASLDRLEAEDPPAGVTVEPIADISSLTRAASIMCEVFGVAQRYVEPATRLLASGGTAADARLVNYAAWRDGTMVAASTLFYGAGVAGVYNVATLPTYRRQGIGRAVTLIPLLDARSRGYRVGVLQATDMGARVYERLGFERHGDFHNYVWSTEPEAAGRSSLAG
jgi:GNAT superfamily N-acetyltransferase